MAYTLPGMIEGQTGGLGSSTTTTYTAPPVNNTSTTTPTTSLPPGSKYTPDIKDLMDALKRSYTYPELYYGFQDRNSNIWQGIVSWYNTHNPNAVDYVNRPDNTVAGLIKPSEWPTLSNQIWYQIHEPEKQKEIGYISGGDYTASTLLLSDQDKLNAWRQFIGNQFKGQQQQLSDTLQRQGDISFRNDILPQINLAASLGGYKQSAVKAGAIAEGLGGILSAQEQAKAGFAGAGIEQQANITQGGQRLALSDAALKANTQYQQDVANIRANAAREIAQYYRPTTLETALQFAPSALQMYGAYSGGGNKYQPQQPQYQQSQSYREPAPAFSGNFNGGNYTNQYDYLNQSFKPYQY